MNIIYLICFTIILKVFYSFYKRKNTKEEINESDNIPQIQSITKTKNSWLYPTNEFGTLEKGVVHDSQTYKNEISDSNNQNFEIL